MTDHQTSVSTPAEERLVMTPLKSHNALLRDKKALADAWESDGYWFFKDVLDKAAVGRLRAHWIRELERQGVIDPVGEVSTERSVRYNGASLSNFPLRMEPLAELAPWRSFVREPQIHAFFTELFGCEPFWVPIAEYRATPPVDDRGHSRFHAIHQDGPYSPGIAFRICWIPLADIDQDIGGMAVVEGMTEQINRHPLVNGTNTPIPLESLPADRWRHTTCGAGDLLLMNLWTPHSGLTNVSDRFRLSLDLRVMESSSKCPLLGRVLSITPERLVIADGETEHTVTIDTGTYARNHLGEKLTPDDIVEFYQPGAEVIVAHEGGQATVVRPPH